MAATALISKAGFGSPDGRTYTFGTGTPEGAVTAPTGSIYSDSAGFIYEKKTGAGNTGWVKVPSTLEEARTNGNTLAGDVDFNGNKATGLANPTAATDAVNLQTLDDRITGLDKKESCRVATTAALPANTPSGSGVGKIITANGNGVLSIDDITSWTDIDTDGAVNNPKPPTGTPADRVMVKDEGGGTSAHNGIYVVKDKGTAGTPWILERAIDADEDDEVTANLYSFISEGTVNADNGWTVSTNDPIIVDTTAITFVQFTGTGQITAGAGLTKSGNVLNVGDINKGIQANVDDLQLDASEVVNSTSALQQVTGGGNEHLLEIKIDTTSSDVNVAKVAVKTADGLAVGVDNTTIAEGGSNRLKVADAIIAQLNQANTTTFSGSLASPSGTVLSSFAISDADTAAGRDTVRWLIRIHEPSNNRKYSSIIAAHGDDGLGTLDFAEYAVNTTGTGDIPSLSLDVVYNSNALELQITTTATVVVRTTRLTT